MQKFHIDKTNTTPEIYLSPSENLFIIRGTSSPEDVRSLYYPVIDWFKIFIDDILDGTIRNFNAENPLRLQIDLEYFNSSSAKFLFDILTELKKLIAGGIPVRIWWFYDEEDSDMKEAGADIATLVEMEFTYYKKSGNKNEGPETAVRPV